MTDLRITRQLLRQWNACYSDERIAALVPPDGLTLRQVAALPIPTDDRLWVLLRSEVLPEETWRLLACKWAREAMLRLPEAERDPRSMAAIEVAERHALGEATDEEQAAAMAAAWDAAWDAARAAALAAARDAAWDAARDAAWDAAMAAAWDAARDAARDAAMAAAWDAARDAARDAQLDDIVAELPEDSHA